MALQCNLNARGKAARLIGGIGLVLAGVLLATLWALPAGRWPGWTVSIATVCAGAFMIFESRAGWCVLRAMGFRTPI